MFNPSEELKTDGKKSRAEIPNSGHEELQWTITKDSFVLSV